ncbi:MAG: YlxR family protein [Fimbriimonadaceae bacterium]|nr:YlxR family protein [Fimbriimonadaceae bacterium]QYK59305.1 MAG: YlxR family protein [Fimbriimonadaceae bacterium]
MVCRQRALQSELLRVGRDGDGWSVTNGRPGPGRGAYVCADQACWSRATEKSRLERGLKARLTEEDQVRLRDYLASITLAPGHRSRSEEG